MLTFDWLQVTWAMLILTQQWSWEQEDCPPRVTCPWVPRTRLNTWSLSCSHLTVWTGTLVTCLICGSWSSQMFTGTTTTDCLSYSRWPPARLSMVWPRQVILDSDWLTQNNTDLWLVRSQVRHVLSSELFDASSCQDWTVCWDDSHSSSVQTITRRCVCSGDFSQEDCCPGTYLILIGWFDTNQCSFLIGWH